MVVKRRAIFTDPHFLRKMSNFDLENKVLQKVLYLHSFTISLKMKVCFKIILSQLKNIICTVWVTSDFALDVWVRI